jgi:hypothetical protein
MDEAPGCTQAGDASRLRRVGLERWGYIRPEEERNRRTADLKKDTAIVLTHVPGKDAKGQPVARQNALHCALDQTRIVSRIKASSLLF